MVKKLLTAGRSGFWRQLRGADRLQRALDFKRGEMLNGPRADICDNFSHFGLRRCT